MVASSSTAAQAAENEKRKKQTMEKVKVNHLSRQLQMRLQYARLKVEHGWQKQNLNEVENLYFHNSHLRGSKSYPVPTVVTAHSQPPPFPPPQLSFAQSRLSFRYGSTPVRNAKSGTSILDTEPSGSQIFQDDPGSHDGAQASAIPDHSISTINMDASVKFNVPDVSSGPMLVDSTGDTSALSMTSAPVPSMPVFSSENTSTTLDDHAVAVAESTASPQNGPSPNDVSQSSNNHYPTVKPARSRSHKAATTSRALPSLTARDMYNFGSSSTLTYDSFWSSHSGSTTPRPVSGGSTSTAAPGGYMPSFQVPGDFTSGIQDHARPNSIFTTSSNATTTTTYLEIPRNPGGPI